MSWKKAWLVAGIIAITTLTIMCSPLYLYLAPVLFPPPLPEGLPLADEVIEDLCTQLDLPKTDPLCDGSGEVRERDFFPKIGDAIDGGILQNEAEWEERFGTYLVECHEVAENADGIKPTRCDYNFNHDRIYFITVIFINGQFDRIFYLRPGSP